MIPFLFLPAWPTSIRRPKHRISRRGFQEIVDLKPLPVKVLEDFIDDSRRLGLSINRTTERNAYCEYAA